MSKKLKKAIIAGLAGIAGAKLLSAKADAAKKLLSSQQTDTADFGNQMANDTVLAQGTRKAMLPMLPKKKPMGIGPASMLMGIGEDEYGLPAGAKKGKMIKASKGTAVVAKCKLGRTKATKIY
jgi:hypothetical protein